MADSASSLVTHSVGEAHVVEFLDKSLLDQANIERVHEELRGLVTRVGYPKIVISFDNVNFISSAVLGMLMSLQKMIKKADGEMRLSHIGPKIMEVFKLTKLDKIVKIYRTTDEALVKF